MIGRLCLNLYWKKLDISIQERTCLVLLPCGTHPISSVLACRAVSIAC